MTGALKALGATVSAAPHGALSVVPPSYRGDLKREIDVVEEVARVVGYERIPATMPAVPVAGGRLPERLRLGARVETACWSRTDSTKR